MGYQDFSNRQGTHLDCPVIEGYCFAGRRGFAGYLLCNRLIVHGLMYC